MESNAFELIVNALLEWCVTIMTLWQSVYVTFAGITVNLFAILCGAFLIAFVISVFWKGARG